MGLKTKKTEKRKRHRKRFMGKHIAKMEALQIQDHDNTTSSIATLKAPRAIQTTGSPIAVQDDSPVKVLHDDPYVTNTGPGELNKSICTGKWPYRADHSLARSGINVW